MKNKILSNVSVSSKASVLKLFSPSVAHLNQMIHQAQRRPANYAIQM